MDDRTELERDARLDGSDADQARSARQADAVDAAKRDAVERVDSLGRPLGAEEELPKASPEAAPHHDQADVPPTERSIGQDVRSATQNGQAITR
jgi:hypothetical protein